MLENWVDAINYGNLFNWGNRTDYQHENDGSTIKSIPKKFNPRQPSLIRSRGLMDHWDGVENNKRSSQTDITFPMEHKNIECNYGFPLNIAMYDINQKEFQNVTHTNNHDVVININWMVINWRSVGPEKVMYRPGPSILRFCGYREYWSVGKNNKHELVKREWDNINLEWEQKNTHNPNGKIHMETNGPPNWNLHYKPIQGHQNFIKFMRNLQSPPNLFGNNFFSSETDEFIFRNQFYQG
jgi:hypothetical protein